MDTDYGGDFGGVDVRALKDIRNIWIDLEPLVEETGYDDPLDPTALRISLSEGILAETGRFDVRWSRLSYYSFHYTEPGLDARFDRHPKPDAPETHFHEPPDAGTVVESCIRHEVLPLVTRAVVKCWRQAHDTGEPARLNELENPP